MAFVALGACPPTTMPIEYFVSSDGQGEPASCTFVVGDDAKPRNSLPWECRW